MGRSSYRDHEDISGVFSWIFEEAEEEAIKTFKGANYDVDDDTSGHMTEDSYETTDYTRSSCEETSTMSSRVSLAYSEGDSRRDLQRKAHLLTQKIMEQERRMSQLNSPYKYNKNTSDNKSETIRKSKPGEYFVSLNDIDSRSIDRLGAIVDEEESVSTSSTRYAPTAEFDHSYNGESGRCCGLPKTKSSNRLGEEERDERISNQKKKKLMRKRSNSYDDQEKLEKVNEEDNSVNWDDFTTVISGEPEEIRKDENLGRKVKRKRRVLFCSLLLIFSIIMGASVASMFFLFNRRDDTSTSTLSSDIGDDSKKIRNNSSFSFWGDPEDSVTEDDDSSSKKASASTSTGEILLEGEAEEDISDTDDENDGESSVSYNSEHSSTTMPTTEPYEEDFGASEVDSDLLEKHLEAYERWKQENGVGTDDDDDNVNFEDDVDIDSIDIGFGKRRQL